MKILAFSDLHGRINLLEGLRKKADAADIIVSAGDLTSFEAGLRSIMSAIDSWGKPTIMINGNHEDSVSMERESARLTNTVFIHRKSHRSGRHLFLGYGGGGFMQHEPDFEKAAKDFAREIRKEDKVILVTHGPPHGTMLDIIGDDHVGCHSYTSFIESNSVHVYICGHLHENQNVRQNYNNRTIILNPGPKGIVIEI